MFFLVSKHMLGESPVGETSSNHTRDVAMGRDQPNSWRKMRDFTGCFWKYAKFHGKFMEGVSEIHEKFTGPQTLFQGAMLMQTEKSVEQYICNFWTTNIYYIFKY